MSDRAFVLISDDDGHWYVCPADKQSEASAYFETIDDDEPCPAPEGLEEVGGAPSLVEFTGYTIK